MTGLCLGSRQHCGCDCEASGSPSVDIPVQFPSQIYDLHNHFHPGSWSTLQSMKAWNPVHPPPPKKKNVSTNFDQTCKSQVVWKQATRYMQRYIAFSAIPLTAHFFLTTSPLQIKAMTLNVITPQLWELCNVFSMCKGFSSNGYRMANLS